MRSLPQAWAALLCNSKGRSTENEGQSEGFRACNLIGVGVSRLGLIELSRNFLFRVAAECARGRWTAIFFDWVEGKALG
jgi:hypothetical protein